MLRKNPRRFDPLASPFPSSPPPRPRPLALTLPKTSIPLHLPLLASILTDLDEGNSPIVLADYFFDAIFVMDTCLQFYLPFVDEATGTVVTDKKAIKDRYVRSWSFYISVVACLPILNIIPTAMNVDVGIPRELINLLRMSRVLHFMPAFKELKFYMNKR